LGCLLLPVLEVTGLLFDREFGDYFVHRFRERMDLIIVLLP